MKTKITKKTCIILSCAVLAVGVVAVHREVPISAQSVQQLQGEIDQLESRIQDSQDRLQDLREKENTLENRLEIIRTDIDKKEAELQQTREEIAATEAEIRETERELERQKEQMQDNATTLYKEGDPSTLEMLFSSDDFSDFIDRKQYLDSVKESLDESARKVKQLQDELQEEKATLEEKRQEQAREKRALQSRRNEQQRLLEETRGQEREYREMLENLRERKKEAEKRLLDATAPVTSGDGGSGVNVNEGDNVQAGDVVGFVGSSGMSTGPHLHFTASNGGYFNPRSKLGNEWLWPIPEYTNINPGYGSIHCSDYTGPPGCDYYVEHRGLDFAAPWGTPIVAVADGVVWDAGCWAGSGFGNLVIVEHGNDVRTYYPHMGSGCY